ncbi:hypothetical protein Nocox_09335 [Nonomuraea coxensis DSM 45129]|uniref:Uncharacterized protein n=1 Tax=Nonomuraea coxensis DSM 45129 TaxID=1122611 RepID=A0ABX8TVI0_9ACTN|nr:hypothetical protein Nocox_09335 [Nonomuraea coxensis DSM 45129]
MARALNQPARSCGPSGHYHARPASLSHGSSCHANAHHANAHHANAHHANAHHANACHANRHDPAGLRPEGHSEHKLDPFVGHHSSPHSDDNPHTTPCSVWTLGYEG